MRAVKVIAVLAVLAVVGYVGAKLDLQSHLSGLTGAQSQAAMVGLTALSCLMLLPTTPMNVAAGAAHGTLIGSAVALSGCTLGAMLCFLLGRTLLRGWAEEQIHKDTRLVKLDAHLGEHGFFLVLLLRLSPVFPFPLMSYLLGATRLPFVAFTVATAGGLLPGVFLYSWISSDVSTMTTSSEGSATSVVISVVASVLSIGAISYYSKRMIDEVLNDERAAGKAK